MTENALTRADQTAIAVSSETAALMDVIVRAASDPSIDVDKLERLMSMHERAQDRSAKLAYTDAKLAMASQLPHIDRKGRIVIVKRGTDEVQQDTPFARLEDIQAAIQPVLDQFGFVLDYRNGLADDGKVRVTTRITHRAGHSEETHFDLPHDSSGSKNAVQAIGSSTTYGMRYGTIAILNLRVIGGDDDGANSDAPMLLTDDQVAELQKMADDRGADVRKFCQFMKVRALGEIAVRDFEKAKTEIARKKVAA